MASPSTRATWQRNRSNVCTLLPLHLCNWKYGMVSRYQLSAKHVCADKQVFSKLDTVGWYSTGSSIGVHDMQIHKLVGPSVSSAELLSNA